MTRPGVFLLVLTILTGCQPGEDAQDLPQGPVSGGAVQAVEDTIRAFYAGISALSYERIRGLTTEDYRLIDDGPAWPLDSLTARMQSLEGQDVAVSYELSDMETTIEGRAAWTTFKNTGEMVGGGQRRVYNWTESAVLRQEEDGWKVALLHSTLRGAPGQDSEE